MPEPRLFQIHLSTAVVLMLAAGVLLWMNMRAWKKVEFTSNAKYPKPSYFVNRNGVLTENLMIAALDAPGASELQMTVTYERGWPWTFSERTELSGRTVSSRQDYTIAILDFMFGLLILNLVWLICQRRWRPGAEGGDASNVLRPEHSREP